MKYYVTSDIHGFHTLLRDALTEAGYYRDPGPHKLVVLGDLLDRGKEALQMQDFILDLMEQEKVILIRGNHEDLYVSLVTEDGGKPFSHHLHNGTFDTALQLTGFDKFMARYQNWEFAAAARNTPFYYRIIPAMRNYYETEHYVFTHGWIPFFDDYGKYRDSQDWRGASQEEWRKARWSNGMDAAGSYRGEKTVVCGHWHASYGHARFEHKGAEFGPDADFSPYCGDRIIALDACTAVSGRVNVLVLED